MTTEQLRKVLDDYGVPDPSIVGKLPRGGISLDFVGHAEITRILIQVDPNWSWEPVAWDVSGRPAVNVVNGMAVMWGRLTVLGQSRLGVGSAKHDKPDLDKELIGDFLRNAAMRFGISLSLWSKAEWEEAGAPAKPTPVQKVSTDNIARFKAACEQVGLSPEDVAGAAGLFLADITEDDLPKLRASFNRLKAENAAPPAVTEAEKVEAVKKAFKGSVEVPETTKAATVASLKALMQARGFNTKETQVELMTDHAKRPISNPSELKKEEIASLSAILNA